MQLSKRALLARSAPFPQQHRGCVVLPRTAIRARPAARASPLGGDGVAAQTRRLHITAAAAQSSGASTTGSLIKAEVTALEAERDTAISMAESCSKTATKLAEMAMLLEALALEKVRQGDEPGARQALGEKASVLEALEKNSTKADVNYKLAAVLASRISDKQSQLLSKLRPSGPASLSSSSSSSSSSVSSSSSSTSSWSAPPSTSYSTSSGGYGSGASRYSSGSGGAYASSGNGGGSYGSTESSAKWKWQQSLQEARERLKQQEAEALREGRMARMSAEASIAAAKDRIAAQAARSVREGQDRLRAAQAMSGGSLEAAQARLKARDEEALAYVRRIMARYRAGEYVPEKDLEYAFSVLEQRFVL